MQRLYIISGHVQDHISFSPCCSEARLEFFPVTDGKAIAIVAAESRQICDKEIRGQITDGIFEGQKAHIEKLYNILG